MKIFDIEHVVDLGMPGTKFLYFQLRNTQLGNSAVEGAYMSATGSILPRNFYLFEIKIKFSI